MKKIKTLLVILSMMIMLTACSSASKKTTLLDTIKANGYITVATSPDYPPYEFIDTSKTGDAQYVGADIELAKHIADKLGVELKLAISDFSTALASISTKKADIVISGLGYKEERLNAMDFTKTYNPSTDDPNSFQGILMKASAADSYTTLDSFKGLKVGAQLGSLQEGFVNEQLTGVTLTPVSDLGTGIVMLQSGKIDALAIASTTGSQYVSANPDLKMTTVKFAESALAEFDGTIIGVQKGESALVEALNTIIDDVVKTGIYDQWEVEYTDYAKQIGQ